MKKPADTRKLVPIDMKRSAKPQRRLDSLAGTINIPDNFEEIDKQLDKEI